MRADGVNCGGTIKDRQKNWTNIEVLNLADKGNQI